MDLIVYDFDKTIYDGDSSIDFLIYILKRNKRTPLYFIKFIFAFTKYKFKIINKEKMKEIFFSVLKDVKNIDEEVEKFWIINEKKIKKFFGDKLSHEFDIIATASPEFLIKPIAKKFNVKTLFASDINKKTGEFKGINCHGIEKVKRIKEKYPNSIIKEMYSDDIKSDKPLLDIALNSYIVKKDKIISYKKNK